MRLSLYKAASRRDVFARGNRLQPGDQPFWILLLPLLPSPQVQSITVGGIHLAFQPAQQDSLGGRGDHAHPPAAPARLLLQPLDQPRPLPVQEAYTGQVQDKLPPSPP